MYDVGRCHQPRPWMKVGDRGPGGSVMDTAYPDRTAVSVIAITEARAKLYVVLGSHACKTGMLLLEHKGIPYEPVRMPTGSQRVLPALGFPGGTVPAMVLDGKKVQTNMAIARHLEEVQPDPPLYPENEQARRKVEEAEEWADDVLQMAARRLALAATMHGRDVSPHRGARGPLGPILWTRPRMRETG